MSRAFNAVIKRATSTINTYVGNSVIIGSPLFCGSHFDLLFELNGEVGHHLIIIECQPKDKFIKGKRDSGDGTPKWYKSQPAYDHPIFDRDYNSDGEESPSVDGHRKALVSNLVIDTSDRVQIVYVADMVRWLARKNRGWMIDLTRKREMSTSLPFYKLPKQARIRLGKACDACDKNVGCSVHKFWHYMEEGIVTEDDVMASCNACDKSVTSSAGGVYACRECSLALHKSCAELGGGHKTFPEEFPEFYSWGEGKNPTSDFPKKHEIELCNHLEQRREVRAQAWLVGSHLKSQLVPKILHHQGHTDHALCFWLTHIYSETAEYVCTACKHPGRYVAYSCMDDCGVNYHPQCALLPQSFVHPHGGYEHALEMVFQREKELEGCTCANCFNDTSPLGMRNEVTG